MSEAWIVVTVLEDGLVGDAVFFVNYMDAMDYAQEQAAKLTDTNVLVCEIKRNVKVPSLVYNEITDGLVLYES